MFAKLSLRQAVTCMRTNLFFNELYCLIVAIFFSIVPFLFFPVLKSFDWFFVGVQLFSYRHAGREFYGSQWYTDDRPGRFTLLCRSLLRHDTGSTVSYWVDIPLLGKAVTRQ